MGFDLGEVRDLVESTFPDWVWVLIALLFLVFVVLWLLNNSVQQLKPIAQLVMEVRRKRPKPATADAPR